MGNGRSIRIWQDRWLPTPSTYKVISPPSLLGAEARVSELIDHDTSSWNSELIRDVFLLHEAEVILGLVLSSRLLEDRLVWAPSSNGRFSKSLLEGVSGIMPLFKKFGKCRSCFH